jgi:hypothetical protein
MTKAKNVDYPHMGMNDYGVLDPDLSNLGWRAVSKMLDELRPLLDEMELPELTVFLADVQSSVDVSLASYKLGRQVVKRRGARDAAKESK